MSFNCATQAKFPIKFCGVDNEGECGQMNYAVSITPKFGGVLSVLGAALIVYRFFHTPRKERKTHDRLMLGMSIMNLLGGTAFIVGQYPFPYIVAGNPSSSSFCNWQGWALQMQTAVFWYNSVLITVFMLKIRFGWHESHVVKYEPLLHFVALIYPTITSFVALGLHMYGSAGPWCWLHAKYDWARWAFFYAVLWPAMFYSTCCMAVIVKIVKRSDDRTQALRSARPGTQKMGRQTRIVAVQGILYVATFLFTWTFGTANRLQGVYSLTTPTPCSVFGLMWLHSLCVPFQGFGNFLVYIYPRIRDARRDAKLAARERVAHNLTLTRKEALLAFGTRVYKVVFGVSPILSPSQVANDSGKDSGTFDKVSTHSTAVLEASILRPDQTTASLARQSSTTSSSSALPTLTSSFALSTPVLNPTNENEAPVEPA